MVLGVRRAPTPPSARPPSQDRHAEECARGAVEMPGIRPEPAFGNVRSEMTPEASGYASASWRKSDALSEQIHSSAKRPSAMR